MFLVSTVLICAVFSLMTGTSFGTIGTAGLALLGVGEALGFPTGLTAGAIVSGAYFGDKMSPVSDTTNLASGITGTNIFSHIGSMLYTTVPATLVALGLYWYLGLNYSGGAMPDLTPITDALSANFNRSFLLALPPIVLVALAIRGIPPLPTLVMVCALLFSAGIVVFGLHNAKRESDFTSQLTLEKGAALISALEGALRTGMGYHWSDEVLSDLLNKVGEQPDIVSLVITNRNGTVLMAADTKLIGTSFLSPEVLAELDPTRQVKWNATELPDGMPVFQVYKQFSVPQGERRRHGGGHRMMRRGLDGDSCGMLEASIAEGTSLVIFVEYDLTPLEEAQAADEKHMAVMFGILVFVGLVGCITLFLIQSYRRSRKLVQETTAFSSEILRTLPVGIISTDMDDRITSINPAAQDITGLTRTAATGRGLHDLLPGVWAVLEGRTAQDAAREQEAWCTVGERRVPLAISASHIVTEEGEAIGTALIMRDLGEIRRLQSELRRRDRLVALGNMAAGIAHEVRNPLSAIKGLARFFMEASPEGSDESRMADIMTREVLRLDKMVGDFVERKMEG